MAQQFAVVIRSAGARWDRDRGLLWVDLLTEDGRSYSVGVPVQHIAELVYAALQRMGVQCCPEIGDDLASVDGFFGWIKRTAKKASRAVKKATRGVVKQVVRTAGRAVSIAATPWALKRNLRLLKNELGDVKRLAKGAAPLLKAASTAASLVPGVGTGIAAGLGAAAAIGQGKSLAQIGKAAAMSALPGGALTRAAIEAGVGVASGRRVDRALMAGVREAVPGGAAGQAVFDGALAVARGQRPDRVAAEAALKTAEAIGGKAARSGIAAGLAVAQGKRVDRAVLGAARQIAETTVTRGRTDRVFSAISGAGLAALGGANRIATLQDEALAAARRIGAGNGSASDRELVQTAKDVASRAVQLAGSSHPEARLAVSALREQAAPVVSARPRTRSVRALPSVSGPLDGFDIARRAIARRGAMVAGWR